MTDRTGKRKTREQLSRHRVPEPGYYFIVTDTKETERNYMLGLRDSIPEKMRGKLVIKVCKTKTVDLVNEALKMVSLHPQYSELWIVFDRDQVEDFDQIVSLAKENNINVGWSNPCIEIWFTAYFGKMPTHQDSVACCNGFEKQYLRMTKQKYDKADTAIYSKLCRYGNEKRAIEIAARKYDEHERNGNIKPSEMCPGTTVHVLVKEIKDKVREKS